MSDPWFKMDPEAWRVASEAFAQPWADCLVEMDLRFWANEVRRGNEMPGRPALMKRWGWSEWRVRAILKTSNPLQLTSSSPPAPATANAEYQAKTSSRPPAGLHTRDPIRTRRQEDKNTGSQDEQQGGASPLPLPGRGVDTSHLTPDVLAVWRAWYQHHTSARAIRADHVKVIRSALQLYTVSELIDVVEYVHTAPEHLPKVRALREGGFTDIPNILNRDKLPANHELAQKWREGTTVVTKEEAEAWAVKAWTKLPGIFGAYGSRPSRWPPEAWGPEHIRSAFRAAFYEVGGRDMDNSDFTRRRFLKAFVTEYRRSNAA